MHISHTYRDEIVKILEKTWLHIPIHGPVTEMRRLLIKLIELSWF